LLLLYICLSTNIHKLRLTICPWYISNRISRSSYIKKLVKHWPILPYFFFTAIFLLISIPLAVIFHLSTCFLDFCVGPINPGTIGTAFLSHYCGHLWSSMSVSCSISHVTSAAQLSSLSFGLSKSWFQLRKFSVSEILCSAQSSSPLSGWRLILLIWQTFNISFCSAGMSFPGKVGGKDDLSDYLKTAALSCYKYDQDVLIVSSVSEMYLTAVICLFWPPDSFCATHRFSLACHICKRRRSWPFCAMFIPPPQSPFLSHFVHLSYPILCQRPTRSRHWLEETDLQWLSCKGSPLWFWLPPSDNISCKGTTSLHSHTMGYDVYYVVWHIREISIRSVHILLLVPPVGYVRDPQCTANIHRVEVAIIEMWIILPPVCWCYR